MSKFKVGAIVIEINKGYGVVKAVDEDTSNTHPVTVQFTKRILSSQFQRDGKLRPDYFNPVLYLADEFPSQLDTGPMPVPYLELDTLLYVWSSEGDIVRRYFKEWDRGTDGFVVCFARGATSLSIDSDHIAGGAYSWRNYSLTDPRVGDNNR